MARSSSPLIQRARRIGGWLGAIYDKEVYYVYVLFLQNKHFYTGSTSDLKKRLKYHQAGKVSSTKPYRPVKLAYYETYLNKKDALRREIYFKTGDGRKILRKQLENTVTILARSSSG